MKWKNYIFERVEYRELKLGMTDIKIVVFYKIKNIIYWNSILGMLVYVINYRIYNFYILLLGYRKSVKKFIYIFKYKK